MQISRPVELDEEIDRPRTHAAGSVEVQHTVHAFIVHRGVRSVTACCADMTDVILSTVSPAYSAIRSTIESGIPIVGAIGENIGRPGRCKPSSGMIARSGSLANFPLLALISLGTSLVRPSARHHRCVAALATTRCGSGHPSPNSVVRNVLSALRIRL